MVVVVAVVEQELVLVLVLVQEVEIDFITDSGGFQGFLGLQGVVQEVVQGFRKVELSGVDVGVV